MTSEQVNPRRWWILVATSGVLGLVVLDETVVGVALPTIQADLAIGPVVSHWIVNAYLLTFTCAVALGGHLADRFGRRLLFLVGISIFGAASLAAGAAPSATVLLAARAVQGIGSALVFPAGFAIVTSLFEVERRGLAFGLQTTIAACFMASGPVVGGFFSEAVSWRWIFWINLPFVAAIVAVIAAWLPGRVKEATAPSERSTRPDLAGPVALVVGLTALTLGLMQSGEWGWTSPLTLALLGLGGLGLAAFVGVEIRHAAPLIELDLLRIPDFAGGVTVFFTFQFDKIVVFVFLPLYLQSRMGFSPLQSGLPLLIAILPTLATSLLAGKGADVVGARRLLLAGLTVNGLSLVALAAGVAVQSLAVIVAALFFWGAVLPFLAVVSRRTLMSAVPPPLQGQASGVNLTIQMTGGTMGLAIASTLQTGLGSYPLIFLVPAGLVLATIAVAARTLQPMTPKR